MLSSHPNDSTEVHVTTNPKSRSKVFKMLQ